jgi:hypothetical protein
MNEQNDLFFGQFVINSIFSSAFSMKTGGDFQEKSGS